MQDAAPEELDKTKHSKNERGKRKKRKKEVKMSEKNLIFVPVQFWQVDESRLDENVPAAHAIQLEPELKVPVGQTLISACFTHNKSQRESSTHKHTKLNRTESRETYDTMFALDSAPCQNHNSCKQCCLDFGKWLPLGIECKQQH